MEITRGVGLCLRARRGAEGGPTGSGDTVHHLDVAVSSVAPPLLSIFEQLIK